MWSLFSKTRKSGGSLFRVLQTGRPLLYSPQRCFSQPPKHTGEDPSQDSLMDSQITCLMLHPVSWPNHGPHKELYLAEEAIGLVRSLDWEVAKGPLWKDKEKEEQDIDKEMRDHFEDEQSANETQ